MPDVRLVDHATQSAVPLACMLVAQQGNQEHSHDCFELVFVQRGRGLHVIDRRPYPILTGDFYVMRPGDVHRYVEADALRIYNVLFQEHLFTAAEWRELIALPGLAPFLVGDAHRHKISLSPPHDEAIAARCERLRRELAELRPGFMVGGKALLVELLLALDRLAVAFRGPTGPIVEGPGPGPIPAALAYLHANIGDRLTVADLAAEAGLTPNWFGERFAAELGMPVQAYINRVRVDKARVLLETGDAPITSIALDVGFDTCSYFGKVFRQHTGVTPRDYRRLVRSPVDR